MNCPDLTGKIALVTGGRRGLGLALVQALADAGVKVAVAATAQDPGEAVRKLGENHAYFAVNLTNRTQRAALIPQVVERYGRLDILVNCAGIQHRRPALDFELTKWDEIIELMLTAPFTLSQQAARAMLRAGGGKIVNIASLASFQGGWTVPAYAAAKHGLVGLTKALANEWAAQNINVNAIAPGYFATDMCEAIIKDPVREPRIRERIPAGRWGQPEELAGTLLYLVSEASRYVHGQVLTVDGGWMGR